MNLEEIKDIEILKNINLARFTTFRLKTTGTLIKVFKQESLPPLLKALKENKKEYFIIGRGSNLILKNEKDLIFIKLEFVFDEEESLRSFYFPASVSLSRLTQIAKKNGFAGWEVFTGIPASLGGAIFMNAGTRLGEICEILTSVLVLRSGLTQEEVQIDSNSFEYRKNKFMRDGDIILGATLKHKGINHETQGIITAYLLKRNKTQPLSSKNCGCVFKNPDQNNPAGKIIDELGLKGFKYKNLMVSPLHGNFIENLGEATASDILELIKLIQDKVKKERGIEFELEVKVI